MTKPTTDEQLARIVEALEAFHDDPMPRFTAGVVGGLVDRLDQAEQRVRRLERDVGEAASVTAEAPPCWPESSRAITHSFEIEAENMVDFDKQMQIDRAVQDRISDLQKRHPHADLEMARRWALHHAVREIVKLRTERDDLRRQRDLHRCTVESVVLAIWPETSEPLMPEITEHLGQHVSDLMAQVDDLRAERDEAVALLREAEPLLCAAADDEGSHPKVSVEAALLAQGMRTFLARYDAQKGGE